MPRSRATSGAMIVAASQGQPASDPSTSTMAPPRSAAASPAAASRPAGRSGVERAACIVVLPRLLTAVSRRLANAVSHSQALAGAARRPRGYPGRDAAHPRPSWPAAGVDRRRHRPRRHGVVGGGRIPGRCPGPRPDHGPRRHAGRGRPGADVRAGREAARAARLVRRGPGALRADRRGPAHGQRRGRAAGALGPHQPDRGRAHGRAALAGALGLPPRLPRRHARSGLHLRGVGRAPPGRGPAGHLRARRHRGRSTPASWPSSTGSSTSSTTGTTSTRATGR